MVKGVNGMDNRIVGNQLKKLRTEYGFKQIQIADYLGFKQSQITKLENGERKLKLSSLNKLCDLYDCPPEYILEGKGDYKIKTFKFRSSNKKLDLETLANMNRIIRNLNELSELDGD